MRKLTRATTSVLLLALPVLLTACTTGEEREERHHLTAAEAAAQFREEARTLTLAPGWEWPEKEYTDEEDGTPHTYGAHMGRVDAGLFWYCTWADRALSPDLSEEERADAAETLLEFRDTAAYTKGVVKEDRQIYDSILDKAALGDYSELQASHGPFCDGWLSS